MAQQRDQPMAHRKTSSHPTGLHLARLSKPMLVVAAVAAAVLSGCASRDDLTTGGIPDDYRQRHPIVVTEAEQSVDIPIASTDRRLNTAQRDMIRGFAQNYGSRATGPVYLLTPEGSPNSAAARQLRGQVRAELSARGVVSPPLATTICFSGTPSFFAVSAVIGAPTTGAPVCRATGPISEI